MGKAIEKLMEVDSIIQSLHQKILGKQAQTKIQKEGQESDIGMEEETHLEIEGEYAVTATVKTKKDVLCGSNKVVEMEVLKAVVVHNYPHEPDDVDLVKIGESQYPSDIAKIVLKAMIDEHIEGVLENIYWEQRYKEEQKQHAKKG